MTQLSVNVNKVAWLRNARSLSIPNVCQLAAVALQAGAHGITVHPRPDERHIRRHDVFELADMLQDWPHAEYNIEGNPLHNLMPLVEAVRPSQCTLVPDAEHQATSDHGWRLPDDAPILAPLVAQLRDWGVRVSVFIDPDPNAMAHVAALGAQRVELYTESYARACAQGPEAAQAELVRFAQAAQAAQACGLGVNAGHDLNLANLKPFLQQVTGVLEVSIGHALVADALHMGMASAVAAYVQQLTP